MPHPLAHPLCTVPPHGSAAKVAPNLSPISTEPTAPFAAKPQPLQSAKHQELCEIVLRIRSET